jgi:hypothetical protein
MEWHVNDLSLCGQFADPYAFRIALEPILQLRQKRADIRSRIFCSRSLHLRPVTCSSNLQQAVFALGDPTFKRLVLEWFAKAGPFWDDSRASNPDDYFEFEGECVTNQGLGEAARRRLLDTPVAANSFSFLNPPANRFERTPLTVIHGLPEEPLARVEITNCWTVDEFEVAVVLRPTSWRELLTAAQASMELLVLSDQIAEQLRPCPFHAGVAQRIMELLQILQDVATESHDDSSLNAAGLALHQRHFVGAAAAFTDESAANKIKSKAKMTFPDPAGGAAPLFCPWHGKSGIGTYRIHFQWPRPLGQREIKIVYIGPKITKR